MKKKSRRFMYMLIAYLIISIINLLLFSAEFILVMTPDIIDLTSSLDINVVLWIMIGINFIFSTFAYTYVGTKIAITNNMIFNILIILLPFIIGCLGIIASYNSGFEYLICIFNSSLGIFIMFTYDTIIKYVVAIFPSICMLIGYITKVKKPTTSQGDG